eukprot:scaffold14008_cov119-Isochrysis_galbana.AAC.4
MLEAAPAVHGCKVGSVAVWGGKRAGRYGRLAALARTEQHRCQMRVSVNRLLVTPALQLDRVVDVPPILHAPPPLVLRVGAQPNVVVQVGDPRAVGTDRAPLVRGRQLEQPGAQVADEPRLPLIDRHGRRRVP